MNHDEKSIQKNRKNRKKTPQHSFTIANKIHNGNKILSPYKTFILAICIQKMFQYRVEALSLVLIA